MDRSSRGALALAGVLTGIAGLVASQATVWILQAKNGPIVAVASAVRDKTPGDLAVKLVHLVGHKDKPLLIASTTVLLLLLCAWLGTQARRRPVLPELAFFALAVVGLVSVLRLKDSSAGSSFGVVVGLITWLVVFRVLTSPLVAPAADAAPEVWAGSRRAFLQRVGGVGAGVVLVGWIGRVSSRGRRRAEQARRLLRLPVSAGKPPAGVSVGVPGVAAWRTSNDDFYRIDTALTVPTITPGDWSLRIHGQVEKELTISYNDLVSRSLTEDWITLCCVSNEVGGDLISNAYWSGVPIRDLLAEAGVKDGADAVLQTSKDGWTCGTPLAALTDPKRNAMLALAMNGQPLPLEHGFPVRMVVPGLYGYVSATKWLVDLEVTSFDQFDAYWTVRGWSAKGPVKTESRIDVPRDGAGTKTGSLKVGGSAWAQHTGIEKVEFQLDGGPWQAARLGSVPGNDTWVQWAGDVEVGKGKHHLAVRATDKSGYTQTAVRRDVVPDGATGWHTIEFQSG
ncbi:molybdopterin-dependent oxidoreductase [Nocardioides marmorisolisilvae]|uniref:Oxidoreductase n=1 Tax=Nocardioides marmorisolisilvae TaxID=1542737 RepID=A0A3N0DQ47_9ACTN|nr:molybdopterin-dependent oxidoreductase [Nocardioides marmorisolisilvae]RNL77453.1 oxidoreductase [Nocardioides marmorisolisilvae]